jgi:thioredoxin 1
MEEIKESEFEKTTKAGAVVVDFFGAGCINCRMTEPALLALETENPNIKFIKIDAGTAKKLTEKFNISSLPTILFMKDGLVKQTLVGLKPRGVLSRTIAEYL